MARVTFVPDTPKHGQTFVTGCTRITDTAKAAKLADLRQRLIASRGKHNAVR